MANCPTDTRMRVLSVVSSANQLYSGIGRNLFELARRLTDRVAFTFAIDDATPRNTDLMVQFGKEVGAEVRVGPGRRDDDALDIGNADLPALLATRRWDLIECLCWANASTNEDVLMYSNLTPIVYTPHDQPLWTVPMTRVQEARTAEVHQRMVRRADAVLCVSPHERDNMQRLAPESIGCAYLPNGCDFTRHRVARSARREQLLFVGDLAEPRKRFDRVPAVLERLLVDRPGLRLVVIGNKSEAGLDRVPPHMRRNVELHGFVDDEALRTAYGESLGLFLLSDYEAFGIPILEAVARGTPAFVTTQPTIVSLFKDHPGVYFCPVEDPAATSSVVSAALDQSVRVLEDIARSWPRLRATFDWPVLAPEEVVPPPILVVTPPRILDPRLNVVRDLLDPERSRCA